MTTSQHTRRRVLQSILATPVLAGLGPTIKAFGQEADGIIASADKALDVFDFERLARERLPPAHFGYLQTGVDGDATLHANTAGFAKYSLRVRRLVDLSKIDMSVGLFGTTLPDRPVGNYAGARAPRRGGRLPRARADGGPARRLQPPDARARDPARFA